MRLLIDSNILLDVLEVREPHCRLSRAVWKLCDLKQAEGYISALTFANIVYILRKKIPYNEIDTLLHFLSLAFHVVDLTLEDITIAASMKWRDFEDAVQSTTASRIGAEYIITRNIQDFQTSKVRAITPEEYFMNVFEPE